MVRPGEWLTEGWKLIREDIVTHAIIALVISIGSAITVSILLGPLLCGYFLVLMRRLRDRSYRPNVGDIFAGFSVFGHALLAWIALSIVLSIGGAIASVAAWIASAVPIIGQVASSVTGLAWAVAFAALFVFVFPLIADRREDFWTAIQASAQIVAPQFVQFCGFGAVLYVLHLAGGLLCGVGFLIAMPVGAAATTVAYRDVVGLSESAAGSTPLDAAPEDGDL